MAYFIAYVIIFVMYYFVFELCNDYDYPKEGKGRIIIFFLAHSVIKMRFRLMLIFCKRNINGCDLC